MGLALAEEGEVLHDEVINSIFLTLAQVDIIILDEDWFLNLNGERPRLPLKTQKLPVVRYSWYAFGSNLSAHQYK